MIDTRRAGHVLSDRSGIARAKRRALLEEEQPPLAVGRGPPAAANCPFVPGLGASSLVVDEVSTTSWPEVQPTS